MPEGELKETLFKLAEKLSFPVKELLLMDGSKRSSRANAFFTGFGKFRRIVLFDTLTTELTTEETTAVLAHEIGHDKKGHIPRQMIFSFATMLVAFALAAWSAKQAFLFSAFGFSESLATSPSGAAIAFLLLGIIASPIMFWFSPLMNGFSRKYEYEADHFAKIAMGSAAPLVSSLKKLSKSNLPHPNPHPLVAAFYYSHPTVVEREKAMLKD
jgi:STE24 endopeptidase